MGIEAVHGHVGSAHPKIGTHPLGPVSHVRQFIHDEQRSVGGVEILGAS